jgi:hypothetical protein
MEKPWLDDRVQHTFLWGGSASITSPKAKYVMKRRSDWRLAAETQVDLKHCG